MTTLEGWNKKVAQVCQTCYRSKGRFHDRDYCKAMGAYHSMVEVTKARSKALQDCGLTTTLPALEGMFEKAGVKLSRHRTSVRKPEPNSGYVGRSPQISPTYLEEIWVPVAMAHVAARRDLTTSLRIFALRQINEQTDLGGALVATATAGEWELFEELALEGWWEENDGA